MRGTAEEVFVDGTPTNGANPWIDSLVWGGAWIDSLGLGSTGGPVTISFSTVSGVDPYSVLNGTGMTWSSAGLTALGLALEAWEAVASIDFMQAGSSSQADVWFWQGTDAAANGALGWSEVPHFASGEPLYLVCNGQDYSWSTAGLALGGYGFITLIHELGHLLGLAHPHDGGSAADGANFPGVTSAFGDYGDFNLNQGIFTTMSYNDGWGSQFPGHNSVGYGWQATPMALDIAAIQAIYGANTTHAQGANTYSLPSYNAAGTYWSCIWDTAGTDLITNAGSSINCVINLTAAPLTGANAGGYVSYAAGIIGGFTIANGVVIENATGGSGNDTLTGNNAANVLTGGSGNDSLAGGDGNDTLQGGVGNDVLRGDGGTDTASYAGAASGVVVNLALTSAQVTGGAGTDTLTRIENLTGSDYADTLSGSTLANRIEGGQGHDILTGGAGADTLLGGDGNDRFVVALAGDLAAGEVMTGGNGVDELRFAATSASTLTLTAGIAVESVVIGTGTGAMAVTRGTAALNVNAGLAANGLRITGNAGANQLTGSGYDDTLEGGTGNDTLVGGQGDDVLSGGLGMDRLTGGLGADVFIFNTRPNATTNRDVIMDYSLAEDHIHLENAVMTGLGLSNGTLDAAAFVAGNFTSAQDASDRIIYNSTKGLLYYDPDGLGGLAAISFAQIGTGLSLTNEAFEVI